MLIKEYTIAKYLRLSRGDSKSFESQSISNQRGLISQYINANKEFKNSYVKEYIDDGYSGINTDRPNFKRMLEDIEKGLIDCVIVKDLSRLGRNYIDVGEFQKLLSNKNVRLIAINSNFNSFTGLKIDFLFVNLYNQYYSRDLGKKAITSKIAKMKKGEFLSPYAIFGYEKSKIEKNKLIVDKVAYKYVQLIFKLALKGYSNVEIAKILNEKNIPTASVYKKNQGILRYTNTKNENHFWNNMLVRGILKDERYTGKLISYRRSNRTSNKKLIPESKWIIIPNCHETIINEKDFYEIKKIRDKKRNGKELENIFKGKIICPYCKYCITRIGKKESAYYKCKTPKFTSKFDCNNDKFLDIEIRKLVFKFIQLSLQSIMNESTIGNDILKKINVNIEEKRDELIKIKRNKKKTEEEIATNYKNYISKRLNEEKFIIEKNKLMNNFKKQCKKEKLLTDRIYNFYLESSKKNKKEELIKIYSDILDENNLTKEKVDLIIEKIYIHNFDKIEIVWYN